MSGVEMVDLANGKAEGDQVVLDLEGTAIPKRKV